LKLLEIRFALFVFIEVDHFTAFQPDKSLESQNFETTLPDAVENSPNVIRCIGFHQR